MKKTLVEFIYSSKIKQKKTGLDTLIVHEEATVKECFIAAFSELSIDKQQSYTQAHLEEVFNQVDVSSMNRQVIIQLTNVDLETSKSLSEKIIEAFKNANPNLLVYEAFSNNHHDQYLISINFLPVFASATGFPLQISLKEALRQQANFELELEDEELEKWSTYEQERNQQLVDDYTKPSIKQPLDSLLHEQKNGIQQTLDYELSTIQEKKERIEATYDEMIPTLKETEETLVSFMQSIKELRKGIKSEELILSDYQEKMETTLLTTETVLADVNSIQEQERQAVKDLTELVDQGEQIMKETSLQFASIRDSVQANKVNFTEWEQEVQYLLQIQDETIKKKEEYELFLQTEQAQNQYWKSEVSRLEGEIVETFDQKVKNIVLQNEELEVKQEKMEETINKLRKKLVIADTHTIEELKTEKSQNVTQMSKHKARKVTIELHEFDSLYHKVKYLEHTWRINQELTIRREKLTITENELTFETEEIFNLRQSAKEIELFIMLEEWRTIHNRVKIRKLLFRGPKVIILSKDYETLKEKAVYFDLIEYENKLLEKKLVNQMGQPNLKAVN